MEKTFINFGDLPKFESRRFPGASKMGFAAYKTDADDKDEEEIKTSADLLKSLNEMKAGLETKAKADVKLEVTEQIKAVNDAIAEIKNLKPEVTALELKGVKDELAITVRMLDKYAVKMNQAGQQFQLPQNFGSELGNKLTAREADLKNFKERKKGFGSIELEAKAVGNLSSASNLTGTYFVAPTVVPGIAIKPYEQIHLRDILPTGNTNSNIVRYVRDNGGEGGVGMVAEGGTKSQIDRDLQIYDAPVRKIATYFRVPEEMIDDIPYLQSFLTQIGLEEVMLLEDTQILYGDGTGQNLSGLFTNATAFAAVPTTEVVTAPNNFDVLMAAKTQGRLAKTNPTVALLNPLDFFLMRQKKDTTNNYLFLGGGNGIDVNGTLNVAGLRIIDHTSVNQGDFLVFDPRNAAIFDRVGTSVRFYDQDQDNAIKNLITIVIEKRLALPIFRTDGLIKGTFASAITDLTS